jgi:alcohol dehydrogenase YqhD (iron-dependent ADH family)
MESFTFFCPTRIVFGSGKLAETGNEAVKLGKRPLLLTGRTAMQKAGVLKKVTGMLASRGVSPVLFEKIEPNPRAETLDEAVALGLKEGCDFVIGLGGGSPMDSAKAVAAALAASTVDKPVSVWEFTNGMLDKTRPVDKTLPTLLISSTAATGSEGNCASVITRWATREKAVLYDDGAYPTVSIVDPEVMLSLPLEHTRDGVVDMMMHVLEQTFSGNERASVQDRTAEGLVMGMMENLDLAEANPGDLTARENLSWASVAALLGGGPNLGRAGNFVVHYLEHPLSGHTDVSHGHGLATLWPRYMRYIAPKREAKIARFGQTCLKVQPGPSAAEKTLDGIEGWLKQHSLWFNLRQFGASEETVGKMAADAVRIYGGRRKILSGAVPLDEAKAAEIYRMALN